MLRSVPDHDHPRKLTRRAALGGIVVVGSAVVDALALEPNWLDVTVHEVWVPGLPSSLDGFSVAQVTDAHLDSLGAVEEAIVAAVREHNVRLVALTGDLVDSTALLRVLGDFLEALAGTQARVVASLGNWEHWGKIPSEDLAKTYRDARATLLVNESLTLEEGITLFATDDATSAHAEFKMAAQRVGHPQILLTHSPELLDRYPADAGQMALSLAGHTHGGQVRLGNAVVPFVPQGSGRFLAGWYDTPAGRAYVSRGTGTSILPMRFTCRPELPIFRLRQG